MSLLGSLEDLALEDILQIVGLSSKSGTLELKWGAHQGRILFDQGLVIAAYDTNEEYNIFISLAEQRLLSKEQLKTVLPELKNCKDTDEVFEILNQHCRIPRTEIHEVIRMKIEGSIRAFFQRPQGTFHFEMISVSEALAKLPFAARHFVLQEGITPQSVALSGITDVSSTEMSHDEASDEAYIFLEESENVVGSHEASPLDISPPSSEKDEQTILPLIEPSIEKDFAKNGESLEIEITSNESESVEVIRSEEVFNELDALRNELREELSDFGYFESDFTPIGNWEKSSPTRGLSLLKAMMRELTDPRSIRQITLMTLRLAAELMNRAVMFQVKGNVFRGKGQFGIDLPAVNPEKRVQEIEIPLDGESIFKDVLQDKQIRRDILEDTPWNNYLIERLGSHIPEEVFLGPILVNGEVEFILYGDNVPHLTPIGDTDILEIFFVQAGLALEKVLLEERVQEIESSNQKR